MVRVAKPTDPKKIQELKTKINDHKYIQDAIQQLAKKLSDELVERRKT
jgi:hypothetical protein